MKKRVALYFGSFNPIHRGHTSLAEWVIDQELCDEVILIVSPQNPMKSVSELAPEFNRYEMCGLAAAKSKYPDKILVSAIEFVLKKPSYTINTLRHLKQNFGSEMEFSILLGADNMAIFDKWRNYDEILRNYPILVYPRKGYSLGKFADKVTYLTNAPLFEISATEIRNAISNNKPVTDMVCPAVEKYIHDNQLWSIPNDK